MESYLLHSCVNNLEKPIEHPHQYHPPYLPRQMMVNTFLPMISSAAFTKPLNPMAPPFLPPQPAAASYFQPGVYQPLLHQPALFSYGEQLQGQPPPLPPNFQPQWRLCDDPTTFEVSCPDNTAHTVGLCMQESESFEVNKSRSGFFAPKSKLVWKPKGSANRDNNTRNGNRAAFGVTVSHQSFPTAAGNTNLKRNRESPRDVAEKKLNGATTLMIRNIPNFLQREDLIEILDEHCRRENQDMAAECLSKYDFVYLPMDYWRRSNKGYAFVNFTTADGAIRMCMAFDYFRWEGYQYKNSFHRSKKVCEISPAAIQGRDNLEENFIRRVFPREEYQPVATETTPRDGYNDSELIVVGKLGGNATIE